MISIIIFGILNHTPGIAYPFRNNTYTFYDNYFSSQTKNGSFYTISDSTHTAGPYMTGYLGEVALQIDNKIIHHERKVYNLFELIGDLGGVNQIIVTLFGFFIEYYTNKLYEYETVSEFTKYKSDINLNLKASKNKIKSLQSSIEESKALLRNEPYQKAIDFSKNLNKMLTSFVSNDSRQIQLFNQNQNLKSTNGQAF